LAVLGIDNWQLKIDNLHSERCRSG
jgi:hypothetical protein